jgi:hypothetical protein
LTARKSLANREHRRSAAIQTNYFRSGETVKAVSVVSGSVLAEVGPTNPKFRLGLLVVDLKCQAISSISVLEANRLSS